MKKRLVALLVLVLVMMLALVSCGDPIGDWLNQFNPKPEEFAVDFSIEDAQVPSQNVKNGDLVTKPEDPTREGFDFAGWYKDAECTNPWNFDSDKVTQNTVLYGKWNQHVHSGGTATCVTGKICEVCGEEYGAPLGHTEETIPGEAPTCKETGLTEGKKCSVCGETLVAQEEIPATGEHTWGDWIVDKAETDTEDGAKHRDCSVCGDREDAIIPNLSHTHSYESEVTTNPGCETKGEMTFTCGCGHSYTEEIPATGHTAGEAVVENEVAADCKTAGSYDTVVYCESCDAELSRETTTVDPTDHVDEDGDFKCDYECGAIVEPEAGSVLTIEEAEALAALFAHDKYTTNKYYIVCVIGNVYNTTHGNINVKDSDFVIYGLYSYDGETRYDAMTTKPGKGDEITVYGVIGKYNTTLQMKNGWLDDFIVHEHDYSEATCKDVATCSICGATKGELAEHKYVDGVCSVCGHEEGAAVTEIVFDFGANGSASHVDGTDVGTSKSYTNSGYTLALTGAYKVFGGAFDAKGNSCIKLGTGSAAGKFSFTVPDDVVSVTINIAKYKENNGKVKINGTEYTFTKSSNDGQYDAITIDTSTTKTVNLEISSGYRAMIDSIVFTLGETEPECQHEGGEATCENKAVCDLCGEEYGELADHVAGETVVENNVDPNCTEKGSYDNVVYCSVCDKELSRTPVKVDALGHSEEVVSGKAATCTEAGLTDGKKCSVCDKVTVAQEVINALGHNEVVDAAVAATCTTTGLTEGKHCSVCNTVLVVQEVIPAGHSDENNDNRCDDCNQSLCETHIDNEGVVTTPATCTTTGVKTYTCTACGANYTKEIAALGHRLENVPKVNPTCTQPGHTAYQECSREGCDYETMSAVIAPTNHNYSEEVTTPATCVNEGVKIFTCSKCGDSYTEKIAINPDNHSLADVEGKDATCTVDGYTAYKECTREGCDHITGKETIPATGHKDENGDYKCDVCTKIAEPEADSVLTLEEATKLGLLKEHNTYTTNKYYVTGIIVAVESTTYGNISIKTLDGGTFYTYGLYSADGKTRYDAMTYKPVAGDEITIYGVIGQFSGKAQMKSGWLDEVVKHNNEHVWSHEATCDNPATCIMCGVKNTVAHTPSENELTCSTPIICTVCKNELEKVEHVDENKNGKCDVCKADVPISAGDAEIVFELGANGEAKHSDGADTNEDKKYTETVGQYTLTATSTAKMYIGARDEKGNSCLKFGTGSKTGNISFTVPDDVTKVIINIAGYKAATSTDVEINGTKYTIKTASNNGEYTAIEIDTTTTKTITLVTVTYRAMIDSIVFVVPGEIKSHEHNVATKEENRVESTCTVKGHYDLVTYCADEDCGKEIGRTEVKLDTADHSYNPVVTKPTCTEDGYTTYTCSVCGHSYEDDPVDALGHNEVAHDAKAATCTEAGHKAYVTCARCNYTTYEEVAKLGHDLVDVAEKKATCTEAGYSAHKDCSRCDYIEGKEDYAVLDHSWKNATCEAPKTCGACGATEGEKLGHTEVTDAAVAATCTTTGLTEGKHCSVCGAITQKQEVVSVIPHTTTKHEGKAATCTETGYEAYETCSKCNYTTYKEIAKLGHNEVAHNAKDPTCTEVGNKAYVTCSRCDYTTYEEIPAQGHSANETNHCSVCGVSLCTSHKLEVVPGKAATCITTGLTDGERCSVCGDITKTQDVIEIDSAAHKWNEGTVTTNPTCTTAGEKTFTCQHNSAHTKTEEVAKLGHDLVDVAEKKATCTVDGYTAHKDCSRCDYTEGKTVIPAGHSYTSVVTDPTCTEAGYTTYTCSVCGDSYREDIAINAEAHKWNEGTVTTAPTCTTAGEKTFTCQHNPAHTYTEEVAIDAEAHKWNKGTVTTNPTCTTAGEKTFTCQHNSAHTKAEEVTKLGHDIVTDEAKAPTCTKTGLTEGSHCSRCDDMTVAQKVIPSLDHDIVIDEAKAPTCTETGLTEGSHCSRCGEVKVAQETVPAINHKDKVHHDAVSATCTLTGKVEHWECPNCKKNFADETCTVEIESITIEINSANHVKTTNHDEDPATCTVNGYTAGTQCDDCGTWISGHEEIPAGHKDVDIADHICDVCEEKVSDCADSNEDEKCDTCGKRMPVEKTSTLTFANTDSRVSQDANKQVWSANGITFTNNKGASTTDVANYSNPVRLYKGSDVIIEATGMTKIVFRCSGETKYHLVLSNGNGYTVSSNNGVVTVTFAKPTDTFEISKLANQTRFSSIDVTTLTEAPTLESITAEGMNTTYTVGDELSLEGLVVKATLSDGTINVLEERAYTVDISAVNSAVAGTYTIVISYNDGFDTREVEVTVEYKAATVTGITVSGMKTEYYTGETVNTDSTITATYSDGTTDVLALTEFYIDTSNVNNKVGGTYNVVFTYNKDVTITYIVQVTYTERTLTDVLKLADGTAVVVTGTVVSINENYTSSTYTSAYISDDNGTRLYIFKLTGTVSVGQIIRVNGTISTYNGDRQISQGAAFELVGTHECSKWTEATCTSLSACIVCGTTRGELKEHNHVNGVCTECGDVKVEEGQTTVTTWEKVELADIKATDVIVIVWTKGTSAWAMSNDKGTGSAPTAVGVTINGEQLKGDIADNIKWNIVNNNGTLTIYPNGTTAKWLYCTSTNNGVRVGTNANKAFTIDATSDYLKNTTTSRYLGVYNSADVRCYNTYSGTSNIANQTIAFYKLTTTISSGGNGSGSETPAHECESICGTCGKCTDKTCNESVCADKCAGHTTSTKFEKASTIAVGDKIVIVCTSKSKELTSIASYGTASDYANTPTGNYILTVVSGSSTGTFALQTSDGKYLSWSSGNSLALSTTLNSNSSWKITFSSGNAVITNAKDASRKLQYNAGSPRFACYTSSQTAIQIYKQG